MRNAKKSRKQIVFLLLAALLWTGSLPQAATAQDRALDRYKHFASQFNHGRGSSDSADAASLSWLESYVLDSYIDIYNSYKDTAYLDNIVDHFDRVKDNAVSYGGGMAWTSPKYTYQHMVNDSFDLDNRDAAAPDLLVNGSFETSGTDGVPQSWTRVSGNNSVVYRTTVAGEYATGSAGLAVKYYNGTNDAYLKQSISYAPGRKYVLTYAAKTNSRKVHGRIQIYNETTSSVIAETATYAEGSIFVDDWIKGSLGFTAPATAGQTVTVRLKLSKIDQSGWTVYYDDLSVKPVETIVNTVKNAGFETGSGGDSTLPDQWARGFGTTSSYAYRSNAAGEYVSGSSGLVVKSDGIHWKELYQPLSYTPGAQYSLTFQAKTNHSSAYGRACVYNAATDACIAWLAFNNTAWQKHSLVFTAPSSASDGLQIILRQHSYTASDWIVYFDDIEIEPVVDNVNGNSGFDEADSGDSTLPAGWERYQSDSGNAYRSDVLNEYFYPYHGAVIRSDDFQVPMLRKKLYLIPGMKYTVSFVGRNNSPAAQGQVEVYNASTSTTLGSKTFSNTGWAALSFSFTAPDSLTDTIHLRIRQATTATDHQYMTYIDDMIVTPAPNKSADGWIRSGKTPDTAYVSLESGHSLDGKGLVVGNDGTTDGYVTQQLRAYTPNAPYAVYFYGKTSNPANGYKVVVYNVTTSTALATATYTNTNFEQKLLDFTTPAAASDVVEIRLTQHSYGNPSDYAYFDRVRVGERAPFLVNDTMIVNPILKFVKAVYDDPELHTDYKAAADEYLAFIEEDILPKWDADFRDHTDDAGIPSDAGVYVTPSGNKGGYFPERTLPHNQYLVAAECYLYLWDITGTAGYLTRAEKLFNHFKDQLTANGTAYKWNYWDNAGSINDGITYTYYEEDTSHANLDIAAVVAAYHFGVVFDGSDMKKFASTFVDKMWDGSTTQPVIGPAVNVKASRSDFVFNWTPYIWDWIMLAEFDPQIWEIANTIAKNMNDNVMEPFAANLAIYNPETIFNGDFEYADADDGTLPAAWGRYQSTAATAYRDETNAFNGDAGAALKTNGSSWNMMTSSITDYLPNSPYELKFYAKAGSGSVQARADVYDYTAGSLLGTTNVSSTSWTPASFSFLSPSGTSNNVRVDLYHNLYSTPDLYAYFDQVKLLPSLWDSYAPNGGFEETDWFDNTLPKYWTRSSGTAEGKVVLDSSEKYRGTNSIKLTTQTGGGNPAQQLVYNFKGFKPGASYTLTFYSKTNGSAAKARGRVRNETASANLAVSSAVNSTAWTNYTVTFTAPGVYSDVVNIYLEHDDPAISGGIAYFDEVGVLLN